MAVSVEPKIDLFLRSEFSEFIKGMTVDDRAIELWTNSFIDAYSEPQRYYHTIRHIHSMLKCFKDNSHMMKDQKAVQLAIFFHDWVYDPTANDNEIQSIKIFQTFAQEFDVPNELRDRVAHYIEATIKHSLSHGYDDDIDLKLFLDFDLEVLGR